MMYWMDGRVYRQDMPALLPMDRGFTLGDGFFETILIRNSVPCFWQDHMKRLMATANKLSIHLPFDPQQLRAGLDELLEGVTEAEADYALRISISRGTTGRGLAYPNKEDAAPSVIMTIAPYGTSNSSFPRVMVSSVRRNEGSPISQIKSLNYLDNIFAKEEATRAGYDDALMLNNKNEIACITIGNVFFVKGERILTPPTAAGVLPGIVRNILCTKVFPDIARLEVRSLSLKDVKGCHFFTTNSLQGVREAHLYHNEEQLSNSETVLPPLFLKIKQAYDTLLEKEVLGTL